MHLRVESAVNDKRKINDKNDKRKMNDKTKILLVGGWGYSNRGDEAILSSTLYNLKETFKDEVEIILTSVNQDETKFHHNLSSIPSMHANLNPRWGMFKTKIILLLLWRLIKKDNLLNSGLNQYIKAVRESDIMIMAGGGYFNDHWQDAFPARYFELLIAHTLNKPVFIIGQTLGPFDNKISRLFIKKQLEKIKLIIVRDNQSKEILQSMGIKNDIRVTADEANIIDEAKPIIAAKREKTLKIGVMATGYRKYVAPHNANLSVSSNADNYYNALAEIFDKLIEEHGATINFIASANYESCNEVISRMKHKKYTNYYHKLSCDEFIAKIQMNDYIISTNMHPLIIGNAYNLPTIALSYNFKIDNFMDKIGRVDKVWNIEKIDPEKILETINHELKNYDDVCKTIKQDSISVRKNSKLNSQLIFKWLKENNYIVSE